MGKQTKKYKNPVKSHASLVRSHSLSSNSSVGSTDSKAEKVKRTQIYCGTGSVLLLAQFIFHKTQSFKVRNSIKILRTLSCLAKPVLLFEKIESYFFFFSKTFKEKIKISRPECYLS